MHQRQHLFIGLFACLLAVPASAFAGSRTAAPIPLQQAAGARLVSVTAKDGGCVAGPTGPNVEAWDVQPGRTYTLTIDRVTDCANGGTDATIELIIKSSALGNTVVTANKTATGVYTFDYQVPLAACETNPIRYCTTNGQPNSGLTVGRHDTGMAQSHLRAANFGAGCANPTPISCTLTSAQQSTWGTLKQHYR